MSEEGGQQGVYVCRLGEWLSKLMAIIKGEDKNECTGMPMFDTVMKEMAVTMETAKHVYEDFTTFMNAIDFHTSSRRRLTAASTLSLTQEFTPHSPPEFTPHSAPPPGPRSPHPPWQIPTWVKEAAWVPVAHALQAALQPKEGPGLRLPTGRAAAWLVMDGRGIS